jgi:GTP pyrophosphokinase
MSHGHPRLARSHNFIKKAHAKFETSRLELLKRAIALSETKEVGTESLSFKAAELMLEHGADADTLAAALLAQSLWEGHASRLEIRKALGHAVAGILEGIKPSEMGQTVTGSDRREAIQALLSDLSKTPRKALLLIAFRLVELGLSLERNPVGSRPLAQETIDLYVPIASQLSLGGLRRRLEDMCFRILAPLEYEDLKRRVAPLQAEDDSCLKLLTRGVRRLLKKNSLRAEIKTRIKSLYGIHRKMTGSGKRLDEIMDRLGMRIIVASVPECYAVLGLLHTHYKPIPGTFDDYIGLPKDNGYQSLHTCVYPVREISHKPIEFQVRTTLMHMEAERGRAAHWLYKNETPAQKVDSQIQWMKGLLHQHRRAGSTEAFVETLHRQVYSDHLVVFSNGGRILRVPDKATVQDYLDKLHVPMSPSARVRVNGKLADRNRILQDGDSIEIIENDHRQTQKTYPPGSIAHGIDGPDSRSSRKGRAGRTPRRRASPC